MKGSVKANLIIFFIVAIIAFCISSAFATLTIHEDNDSYKLIPLKDDSFEPKSIDYVPTYVPKNDTNATDKNNTLMDDIEDTLDNWTGSIEEWTDNDE